MRRKRAFFNSLLELEWRDAINPLRSLPLRLLLVFSVSLALCACSDFFSDLSTVKRNGVLKVATRNASTTYYQGPRGPMGIEYDLAKRFADELGVELEMVDPPNLNAILSQVEQGDVHFAAAGLTVTESRKERVRFTPPYQTITQQLVYRLGTPRPRSPRDLAGDQLEVVADSSHAERLQQLKEKHPELEWTENDELGSEELLNLVWEQVIDYTVADSNEVALNRRFYPELRVGFDLSEPQQLAWAFPKSDDDSLFNAAVEFFERLKESGELGAILERYYGHVEDFDYVGTRTYMRHIQQRLPRYREDFEKAGERSGLDWRLLAAMGYQESHWDPRAVSPTGVKGIMMLTIPTAEQVGIDNRLDPTQSIIGGAQYFKRLKERIPQRIPEPDRTWLALAAYNVGFWHVEDARIITEMRGGDPDKWSDVQENLPLLARKKWYKRTRSGYARGWEPVRYVENIRSYYDILVWITDKDRPQTPSFESLAVDSPAL